MKTSLMGYGTQSFDDSGECGSDTTPCLSSLRKVGGQPEGCIKIMVLPACHNELIVRSYGVRRAKVHCQPVECSHCHLATPPHPAHWSDGHPHRETQ
eukprot:4572715-Pyramimonas_sp.AAC.1